MGHPTACPNTSTENIFRGYISSTLLGPTLNKGEETFASTQIFAFYFTKPINESFLEQTKTKNSCKTFSI
jgi:hypothetical protein